MHPKQNATDKCGACLPFDCCSFDITRNQKTETVTQGTATAALSECTRKK